ncbi:uncharacterized protein LOC127748701 [Frankliniella occidentalis]|uniref:Uncharacterized protein LOC127748701 n=1 Tax=Frankliniella occidentalis TaxID=133901 RepID=A0A9C6U738_FRAOC|nr:uncharacterized protein LOC127748701 [Frankliniella occidentalis]
MECRPKQHGQHGGLHGHDGASSHHSSSHAITSRRRFRRKKKSSVSESESSPPSPKYSVASVGSQSSQGSQSSGLSSLPGLGPGSLAGDREEQIEALDCPGQPLLGGQLGTLGGSLPSSPQPMAMWGPGPRRKISDSLLVPNSHAAHALGRSLRAQNSCPETSVPLCCSRLHSHGYGSGGPAQGLAHHREREVAVSHLVHPPSTSLLHSATIHSPPTSLLLHQSGGPVLGGTLGMAASLGALPAPLEPAGLSTVETLQHKLQASEEQRHWLQRENQMLSQRIEELLRENQSLRDQMGHERVTTAAYIMRQMDTMHLQRDTHV